MIDVVRCIQLFNRGRDKDLLAMKYERMRRDPFAFLRGTCHLFYQRLPHEPNLRRAPRTWLCGDLHLENFGSYKGDNRLVYFDMNDFDEAVLAPCSWDLVRFLVSLRVGTSALSEKRSDIAALCGIFVESYARALVEGKARWVERDTAEGAILELLDAVRARSRSDFLDRRTIRKGNRRRIRVDGERALPLSAEKRAQLISFMQRYARTQPNPGFFAVIDVAKRIAGTGSLGLERYAILVEGKGSPDANYFLELKEALPSSLLAELDIRQPRWNNQAARVVAVQRRMQAVSMAFLQPVVIGAKSYVLRGLQPSEDRINLDHWRKKTPGLEAVVKVMGQVVAWAQLRSSGRQGSATIDELIDFGRGKGWRKQLLVASERCSLQVEADWHTYSRAFDAGAFNRP